MSSKTTASLKSFVKFEIYAGLMVAFTELQKAGTLDVNWKLVGAAVLSGLIKAAFTWWKTEA
jgi:hypothetical protein